MRLIDKDELLEIMYAHCTMCKKRSDYYPSKCRNCDLDDGIDVVECFETIEAIPIEFINDYLGRFKEDPNFRKENDFDQGFVSAILELIMEWKDHEIN